MSSAVSHQRFTQEVKDRKLLLAAGFDYSENPFDKLAARIRLSTMRRAPPDHRVRQGTFGAVVGRFKSWYGHELPQGDTTLHEATTRRDGARRSSGQAGGQPVPDLSLDGWELRQKVVIG